MTIVATTFVEATNNLKNGIGQLTTFISAGIEVRVHWML